MILELVLLILKTLLIFVVGFVFFTTMFHIITFRKKCNGTELVDGCGTSIYPNNFKKVLISALTMRALLIVILSKFDNKKSKRIEEASKYYFGYNHTSGKIIDKGFGDIWVKTYCCEECWEKHEAVEVMNELTKYN